LYRPKEDKGRGRKREEGSKIGEDTEGGREREGVSSE